MNYEASPLISMGTQSRETMEKVDGDDDIRSQILPLSTAIVDAASSTLGEAKGTLREAADQLRDQAKKASEFAADYTRDEPVRALLISAAAGAVLMGVISLMARPRS